jgi:hypothetical protein
MPAGGRRSQKAMIYVLAVLAAIVAAVVGWFVTGAVAVWIAGLCGMSDFEGGRGMFAFLAVGPVGGLVAMVVSAWLVLRFGRGAVPLGRTFVHVALVLGAVAALVGAGIWVRLRTLDTYTNTLPPNLQFEIRIPATIPVPQASTFRIELHTDKNVGESTLADGWLPAADGGHVILGNVSLAFKTSSRLLVVSLPDQPTRLFRLPLSRDPRTTAILGEWRRADLIDTPGDAQPRTAPADDPVELRYRVQRAGDD